MRFSQHCEEVIAWLLGVASGFVFAPWNQRWWLTLPLLMCSLGVLMHRLPASPLFWPGWWRGWWFGWGHFIVGCHWIAYAFSQAPQVPQILVIAPILLLPAFLSVFIATAIGLASRTSETILHRWLVMVILWPVMEWLRGLIFTGFPWNLLSYAWGGIPEMMQSVALWGPYGLSLWTVCMAMCFSLAWNKTVGYGHSLAVCLVMVVGTLYLWGLGRIHEVSFHQDYGLRIVQAYGSQKQRFTLEGRRDIFETTKRLSQTPSHLAITHLIWPEGTLPFTLPSEPLPCFVMPQASYKILLCGGRRTHQGLIWNTLWAFDNRGAVLGFCDKRHLVPFGEYIPFTGLLKALGFSPRMLGGSYHPFSPGITSSRLIVPPLPDVSVLICYEDVFPGFITLDQRGAWILNVTQDAWFGSSVGPIQHMETSRFRAVELGLPLVRASDVGPSALIDAYGRVMNQISGKSGVLDVHLPKGLISTPYGTYGNTLFWVLILLWLGITVTVMRPRKKG